MCIYIYILLLLRPTKFHSAIDVFGKSVYLTLNKSAAAEDLESSKRKLGGLRTVKKFTKVTTSVRLTRHRFLARLLVDQKERSHLLPNMPS